jgi:hypothetical protein
VAGTQAPPMQRLPGLQSVSDWQGQAHFPNCVLQRWVRQAASLAQASAIGEGWDIAPPAGAAGAAGTGAGWAGCAGTGWAAVGCAGGGATGAG